MRTIYCVALLLAIAGAALACPAQVSGKLQLPSMGSYARMDLMMAGDDGAREAFNPHLGVGASGAMVTPGPPAAGLRIADSKFFLWNGLHLGMAIFDVEMTQRCITAHRCHETNPVMPSSQGGQLGVNFAIVGGNAGISYWLKKGGSSMWWLPPAAGALVHSVGVATGFQHQ